MALTYCACGRRRQDRHASCGQCRQLALPLAGKRQPYRSLEDQIAHNLRAIRQSGQFRITDGRERGKSPLGW